MHVGYPRSILSTLYRAHDKRRINFVFLYLFRFIAKLYISRNTDRSRCNFFFFCFYPNRIFLVFFHASRNPNCYNNELFFVGTKCWSCCPDNLVPIVKLRRFRSRIILIIFILIRGCAGNGIRLV